MNRQPGSGCWIIPREESSQIISGEHVGKIGTRNVRTLSAGPCGNDDHVCLQFPK
jgi:hypothetical protein